MNSSVRFICALAVVCSSHCQAAYLWAWGSCADGHCSVPLDLTNAVSISVGVNGGDLALTSDGRVVEWGDWGTNTILPPSNLTNAVEVSAGQAFGLALKADGSVVAWGPHCSGIIGFPCAIPPNLPSVIDISAGLDQSLALLADGTVKGWGLNFVYLPPDLTNIVGISSGPSHNLSLRKDGTVLSWVASSVSPAPPSVIIGGITNAIAVSAGISHDLALRADGTVAAWGDDAYGECDVPADLTNAVAISAGDRTSMALRADGTVIAWGASGYDLSVPAGLSGVTAISTREFPPKFLALAGGPQNTISISFLAPLGQTVTAGSSASFSVRAVSTPPSILSYQWYLGTNIIAGATNATLSLTNVQGPQAGSYSVVVSNAGGSTKSQTVTLNVIPTIDIAMVPGISLNGLLPGATYHIEYMNAIGPTNAWSVLASVTLTNSPQFYFDTSAIGQPARVYRLVQIP